MRNRPAVVLSLAFVVAASACSNDRPKDEDADGGIDDGTGTAIGPTADDDGSPGGEKFDIAGGGTGDGTGGEGSQEVCKLVDVIIAVDNSGSMQEEIAALKGPVFDSFPQTLLDVGNGLDDFQLAVMDACPDPPFFHNWGKGGDCMFSTGKNFMVSTSADLATEYACVTDLSTSGYNNMADVCTGNNDEEQPANAAGEAVSSAAVFAENNGFVRSDAILFVVAITDEDEQPRPAATPQEIADKYIAAKGTIDNVVFLGIGGDMACKDTPGPYGTAEEASVLRDVTNIFVNAGRGLWWDLCMGDLETAFQEALKVVDSACHDWVPPG